MRNEQQDAREKKEAAFETAKQAFLEFMRGEEQEKLWSILSALSKKSNSLTVQDISVFYYLADAIELDALRSDKYKGDIAVLMSEQDREKVGLRSVDLIIKNLLEQPSDSVENQVGAKLQELIGAMRDNAVIPFARSQQAEPIRLEGYGNGMIARGDDMNGYVIEMKAEDLPNRREENGLKQYLQGNSKTIDYLAIQEDGSITAFNIRKNTQGSMSSGYMAFGQALSRLRKECGIDIFTPPTIEQKNLLIGKLLPEVSKIAVDSPAVVGQSGHGVGTAVMM